MTLGTTPTQGDLLRSTVQFCQGLVAEDSIYAVLHRECFNLFPDSMFADLFTDVGRRSVLLSAPSAQASTIRDLSASSPATSAAS